AVQEARVRGVIRGRRLLYAIVLASVGALVVLVVGIVAPQRFLSPTDLALLGDALSTTARWSAPALQTPNLTLRFDHEAVLAGALAVLTAVVLVLRVGDRDPSERRSAGVRTIA